MKKIVAMMLALIMVLSMRTRCGVSVVVRTLCADLVLNCVMQMA